MMNFFLFPDASYISINEYWLEKDDDRDVGGGEKPDPKTPEPNGPTPEYPPDDPTQPKHPHTPPENPPIRLEWLRLMWLVD